MLVVLVHGEDEDGEVRLGLDEEPCRLNSVQVGHGEIGDDDIGTVLGYRTQKFLAIPHTGDHFHRR